MTSATLLATRTEPRRLGLWLLLALSPFALAPGLHPGLVRTQAGFVPAWNVTAGAALANVATEPDLWRGMGSGAALAVRPLLMLGIPAAVAVQWVMLSCLLLGALAVYVWLQQRLGDRAAGLAALVYLLLPATLGTVYARGSLSGALLLALLPLALAGMCAYAGQRSPLGAAVAVVSMLWMAHVQAGPALAVFLLLAAYALLAEDSRTALLIVLASGAAAVASLLSLWGVASPVAPALEFATLRGLLRSSPLAAEPLQIGVVAFVLSLLTLWALAAQGRGEPAQRRLLWFALAAAALLLALALPWSRWLWQSTGLAWITGEPWQAALLAAPFLAAAACGVVALLPELETPGLYATIVVVIVLASAPWRTLEYTTLAPAARPLALLGQNQVAVVSAQLAESGEEDGAAPRADLTLTWQVVRPLESDANLFFQAVTESPEGPQVVAQLDAPPLEDTPATAWRAGDLYSATYTLDLPADAPRPLTYYVGLYDWRDGTRLAVNGGLDDKIILYGAR